MNLARFLAPLAFLVTSVQAQPRIPFEGLKERRASIPYATHRDPLFVAQLEGIHASDSSVLRLELSSSRPTQLRLYHIPRTGVARFRYVVLTGPDAPRTLELPLATFDPDPQVEKGIVPHGGALLIVDVPGFMRQRMETRLSIGPGRITTGPTTDGIGPAPALDPDDPILDRIHGGWLGKVVGGRLGMPLEGEPEASWDRTDAFEEGFSNPALLGFGPDDDTSLMVAHLLMVERTGDRFTAEDVLETWRHEIAYEYLWKTERHTLARAEAGAPREEWGKGPQEASLCGRIRCDLWGYLFPGDPETAIAHVDRDAPLTNRGPAVDSARFFAAATSLAFEGGSVVDLLERVATFLGDRCPAHRELVGLVLDRHRAGDDLPTLRALLEARYAAPARATDPDHAWAYALPNDALVIASLVYGEGDFGRTVALASTLGHDTDCNAATAGSVLGVLGGSAVIPDRFRDRIDDRLRVAIPGREHWSLRDLARLTRRVAPITPPSTGGSP